MNVATRPQIEISELIEGLTRGLDGARRFEASLDEKLAAICSDDEVSSLAERDPALKAGRKDLDAALARSAAANAWRRSSLGWAARWPRLEDWLARRLTPEAFAAANDLVNVEDVLAIAEGHALSEARRKLRQGALSSQNRERARLDLALRWFPELIRRLESLRTAGRSQLGVAGPIDIRSSEWLRKVDAHLKAVEIVDAVGGAVGKRGGIYVDPKAVDLGGPIARFLPFIAQRYYVPLQVELIPKTSWGASLSNLLTQSSWDRIRLKVTARYGGLCQICGQLRGGEAIECHEVWDYHPRRRSRDGMHVQRLVGLMSVCRSCHGVFHLGFSERMGKGDQSQYRLADINGWSMAEEDDAQAWMYETYEVRSSARWALDLSLVASFSLVVDQAKWDLAPAGVLERKSAAHNATPTRILGAPWRLGRQGELMAVETAA